MELQTIIRESVRDSIKKHVNKQSPMVEMRETLGTFASILEESGRRAYPYSKKERIMVLYNDREKIVLAKKGSSIEGMHIIGNVGIQVSFSSEAEMSRFVSNRIKQDGMTIATSQREISRVLRDSSSGISSFIRRHGVKTGIGATLAALTVGALSAFGPIGDSIRSIADSLGIGDVSMGGSSDSSGWVPMEVKTVDQNAIDGASELIRRLNTVSDVQQTTADELASLASQLRADGMDSAADAVEANIRTYQDSTAMAQQREEIRSLQAMANDSSRVSANRAAQAAADAAERANSGLLAQIRQLQTLQRELEDSDFDQAARGVEQNIQALRRQVRSM